MDKADYVQMMKTFADVQRTYTQYAVALLVVPLTFLKDIVGLPKEAVIAPHINNFLWLGWVGLLVCIATSLAYQVASARLIAGYMAGAPFLRSFPRFWFNLSTAGFFFGLLLLVIGIVTAPPYKPPVALPKPEASTPQ